MLELRCLSSSTLRYATDATRKQARAMSANLVNYIQKTAPKSTDDHNIVDIFVRMLRSVELVAGFVLEEYDANDCRKPLTSHYTSQRHVSPLHDRARRNWNPPEHSDRPSRY